MAKTIPMKDLTPEQRKAIRAILAEQKEADVDPDERQPDETVVDTEQKNGRRILIIEGPDVDRILAELGINEDETDEVPDERESEESDEDDDDEDSLEDDEDDNPPPPSRKEKVKEKPKAEPPPGPRHRYFGAKR